MGPTFTFTQGPDGNQYATGGEVNVDMSVDSADPQASIAKMQQVIASAMAPADPSSQDHAVAASARQIMSQLKAQQNSTAESTEESPKKQPTANYTSRKQNRYKK